MRYYFKDFLSIEKEFVEKKIGMPITFRQKDVVMQGRISKLLYAVPNVLIQPRIGKVEPFVGIKVELSGEKCVKLLFNDMTIDFIEF